MLAEMSSRIAACGQPPVNMPINVRLIERMVGNEGDVVSETSDSGEEGRRAYRSPLL